jgi:phytoene dehydrogenase-like protein
MQQSIAVIGSGMAGLAAARLCRDAGHRVTVFEAHSARGMDAHAIAVAGGVVDVPLLRCMSVTEVPEISPPCSANVWV